MIAVTEAMQWLTVAEVALALKVSERTIRRLIADGSLPAVHIGRSVRIRPADLEAMTGR